MPETEDNIEIETQSMNTETLHDNSIVPMEIQDSQPSELNGQAANQEVIDLENDTGKEKERKQMAPRSNVWNHFNKIKDDKGFLKSAQCKYCSRPMKAESKGHGTSSLSRHLQSCPRNPNKFENDQKQGTLQGERPKTRHHKAQNIGKGKGKEKEACTEKTQATPTGSNSKSISKPGSSTS